MEWYWIVYIVGLIIVEFRLFYKAGIEYGEAAPREQSELLGPILMSAILLLAWPIVVAIAIVVSPFAYVFRKGKAKGTELRKKDEMWDTLRN